MVFHVVLQNIVEKNGNVSTHRFFLFIVDLFGTYQGILNLKSIRNMKLQYLHFLWHVVQNHNFAKSREKPHKMTIFNEEVRPPTLNFCYFFLVRMVPYGSNINVPGFPCFFLVKSGLSETL